MNISLHPNLRFLLASQMVMLSLVCCRPIVAKQETPPPIPTLAAAKFAIDQIVPTNVIPIERPIELHANFQTGNVAQQDSTNNETDQVVDAKVDAPVTQQDAPVQPAVEATMQFDLPPQLKEYESLAIESHPAIQALVHRIQAEQNEAYQESLGPNPTVGLFADEVGNDGSGGLLGTFLSQKYIRGNKLHLNMHLQESDVELAKIELARIQQQITTDVRTKFYEIMLAQKRIEFAKLFLKSVDSTAERTKKLYEGREAQKSDFLQANLPAKRAAIQLKNEETRLVYLWRELAAICGRAELPKQELEASFNPLLVPLVWEKALARILSDSPELAAARAGVEKAKWKIKTECANSITDVQAEYAVGHDTLSENTFASVRVGVPFQTRNRNQGNIAAARARLCEAQQVVEIVRIDLRKRLASEFREYEVALQIASGYSDRLLDESREALELVLKKYQDIELASMAEILNAQQTVFNTNYAYLDALEKLWVARQKIEGLLVGAK